MKIIEKIRNIIFIIPIVGFSQDHLTPFEISGKTATATYQECSDWYRNIQRDYSEFTYFDSIGTGDEGFPIYTFRIFTARNSKPVKLLVMNNIHPGEPEGTDASMMLVRDILENKKGRWNSVLDGIDLNIICQYNVDGTVNRGCCSRANQNGPGESGFRGNAKNLDLNRDFIKCDSRNAKAFSRYFSNSGFELFIDNHTSNGADYQYTLTWFHTRPEKLNSNLVPVMEEISNALKTALEKGGIPTAPYVETIKHVPDSGIVAFWESPRYSTGYAALHHCMGFTVETHMWKPFADRVNVTYAFMAQMLRLVTEKQIAEKISYAYRRADLTDKIKPGTFENVQWKLDTDHFDQIKFLGYEYSYPVNGLTELPLLHFDRSRPWEKQIPYYRYYYPTDSILIPSAYIIPKAWESVLERLEINGIRSIRLPKDTLWKLRVSYITLFETAKSPYEGHYVHYNTHVRDTVIPIQLYKGDHLILVTESNKKFLAAVLEPGSADSYFNWGFFDAVLQQKEWFSEYVWIDEAMEIINNNPALKIQFEKKRTDDPEFKRSNQKQLEWIYRHSEYYEKSHNRLPVYRFDR